jgi:hypothetical protein
LIFYPPKKVAPPLIVCLGNQKKHHFALISKRCKTLVLSKKENFLTEKILFLGGKNLWALLEARFFHLFEISAKIEVL